MPPPKSASEENQASRARDRQARGIKIVIGFLLLSALVVGVFVTGLPLPVRLFVAVTDVIGAAVLAVILRQKFGGR